MAQSGHGRSRFPQAASPLVGRDREVAELSGFVLSTPLVTVTGTGGVGKTRLAAEVARAVASEFPDGVHFVGLGSVTELSLVPSEVAAALGVQQAPGEAPGETLAVALASQRLLLVLDNCEQVARAVAELCDDLLAQADDVHILATSREQLWVESEVRYRLSPLPLPGSSQMADIEQSPAVTLFADRARRATRHFALTPELAPLASRVVARLDGMPLAIELAAARVEALGLAGLADRIDDALPLLENKNTRVVARHRSLAAVAEWSYRLLERAGQRVFRRLAAFPGPFTLEAAEAVAGTGSGATVLQLVDCSLVTPPQPGPDGRMRYSLLQTLRAYGRGLLAEAGEEAEALAALAAFALSLGEEAAAGLATSDDRELTALRWLDGEDATMAAALDWALENDPKTALRLALALAPWWLARGRTTDGYTRLASAAARLPSGGQAAVDAQLWLGHLTRALGNHAESAAHHSAAWEAAGDPPSPTAILALAARSACRRDLGQLAEATEDAEQAVELARKSGDRPALAFALMARGSDAFMGLDDHAALTWFRQATDLLTAEVPGRTARLARNGLANTLAALGHYDAARELCEAGLASCRAAGDVTGLADQLESCVFVEDLAGNSAALSAYLREAVEIDLRTGRRMRLRHCLDAGGNLCMLTERWAEAVTLWAAYDAEGERTGAPVLPDIRREEFMRHIETVLEPGQLRAAHERGSRMTLAAAAELGALLTYPSDSAQSDPARRNPPRPEAGQPGAAELTLRERELVALVARGRTNAEIAGELYISASTVASHLDRIRAKTGARRRADLTRLALREGLV